MECSLLQHWKLVYKNNNSTDKDDDDDDDQYFD